MIQRLLFLTLLILSFSIQVFSQITTSVNLTANGWVIGSPNTSVFSSGYIAIVQEINTALSENQILQNFKQAKQDLDIYDKTRFSSAIKYIN
jgi:hypothetical protein